MNDTTTAVGLITGFGFLLVAGARLGAGFSSLGGIFAAGDRASDWPIGVQEGDVPRFKVEHLDALQPGYRGETGSTVADGIVDPKPNIIELYVRTLGAPH